MKQSIKQLLEEHGESEVKGMLIIFDDELLSLNFIEETQDKETLL